MTNKDVYPETARFERFAEQYLEVHGPRKDWTLTWEELVDQCRSTIGEYEHGTADLDDIFPRELRNELSEWTHEDISRIMLLVYRIVLEDLLLTINEAEVPRNKDIRDYGLE